MAKGIFSSSKGALIFAGSTLLGVALLIGSDDREGALVVAAEEIGRQTGASSPEDRFAAQPDTASAQVSQPRRQAVVQEPEAFEFTPDEELIDDTQGFDPVPIDNGFGGTQPIWGEPLNDGYSQ